MREHGVCVHSTYYDLIKCIKRLREKHRFGTIEINIRNHELIHANIKVTENVSVLLQEPTWRRRKMS